MANNGLPPRKDPQKSNAKHQSRHSNPVRNV
jgi:hypothetical protein